MKQGEGFAYFCYAIHYLKVGRECPGINCLLCRAYFDWSRK